MFLGEKTVTKPGRLKMLARYGAGDWGRRQGMGGTNGNHCGEPGHDLGDTRDPRGIANQGVTGSDFNFKSITMATTLRTVSRGHIGDTECSSGDISTGQERWWQPTPSGGSQDGKWRKSLRDS